MSATAYLLILLHLVTLPVIAQTVAGSISGTVKDPSGSAIAGAEVALISTGTSARRHCTSNDAGDFIFINVQPGEYHLSVRMSGFKTFERAGIILTASERLSVGTFTLELGALEERITVTAQGAAVQTASAERSAAITPQQLNQLLVKGRNVQTLITLLPGVVTTMENDLEDGVAGSTDLNVNGGRSNSNNLHVDGITFGQPGGAPNTFIGVSVDAISEVKVLLANYQAEYGRNSGANIQIVTKSGTRDFHGMASFYKRHEQFNANNFFNNRNNLSKGRYRYNTWNYNIGGPAFLPGMFNRNREKLFFFWNHEYWPIKLSVRSICA